MSKNQTAQSEPRLQSMHHFSTSESRLPESAGRELGVLAEWEQIIEERELNND
jgi:hypothetical protein